MISKEDVNKLRFSKETSRVEQTIYGNARPENFPRVNDYRNPLVAAAFKTMGYVNMFNRGVGEVHKQLKENRNPPAIFNVGNLTAFICSNK